MVKIGEWHSQTLPAYQRRTKEIDAVIAGSYLAGTNTRLVGRALAELFRGSVSKDTVSRVWRKLKGDWEVLERPRSVTRGDGASDPRRHSGARSH